MEIQADTQLINKSVLVFTQPLVRVFENAMFTAKLLKGPRRTRTRQNALSLQIINMQAGQDFNIFVLLYMGQ